MVGILMLAAAFTAAAPIHPQDWINASDYPAAAETAGAQTSQRLAFVIDPDGNATACAPLMAQSTGKFDTPVCNRLMKRSHFQPATENGRPTWGVWTMTVNFMTPGSAPIHVVNYDIVVPVNRLPGKPVPQGVVIQQLVNSDGKVEACNIVQGSTYDAINKLACNVATVLPVAHVADGAGAPVRSVVQQTVMFAVDPAAAQHK